MAAAPSITLAGELAAFDWTSFSIALGVGAFGGVVRAIYVLGDDANVVRHRGRQFATDMVTSIIAAGGMYLLLIAYEAWQGQALPSGLRIPAVLVAGWSRRLFVGWLATLVGAVGDEIVSRVRRSKPVQPAEGVNDGG